jgi:prolyl-tRNA editing enzyme YbaK/EbsC (Cys-tRNA(Pro) deacylase)
VLHPSSQAVNDILAAAGLPGRVRILDRPAPTAVAAAEQLGCPVGAIANSLVFATADDEPVLIMTSGAHRVDLERVRNDYGLDLRRASADFVRTHTSQPIGGVAPVGHPAAIRTLVDRDLAAYDLLWAAGGIPHAVFPLTYADLVRLTDGTEADVA